MSKRKAPHSDGESSTATIPRGNVSWKYKNIAAADIITWADAQDERCIFWLNGWAGAGKSTIAHTIARRYYEQGRLGASIFFSRGSRDVSHAGKPLR